MDQVRERWIGWLEVAFVGTAAFMWAALFGAAVGALILFLMGAI